MKNGVEAWATSAPKYIQEAMANLEAYLNDNFGGRRFAKKAINKFELEYDQLMDSSAELGPILLNYYQTQIGVLIWH